MRPLTACRACRTRRRKCDIPVKGSACAYCLLRKKLCSAQSQSSTFSPQNEGPRRPSTEHSVNYEDRPTSRLSPTQCSQLVQLYFDYVHENFHSLFHRRTVMEELAQGQLPGALLAGMIGLSARFSNDPKFEKINPKERGGEFARECQRMLNLREVSLRTIQACVLLGACSLAEGEAEAESVYYAAACRIAQLLDLPNKAVDTALEREVNLRVWWTLRMIDVWSSAGVRLPRSLPQQMRLDSEARLPMDEDLFLSLSGKEPLCLEIAHESPSSLLAQMVRLNRILMEVYELNAKVVTDHLRPNEVEALVRDASQKLDNWHENLPHYMYDSPENLARYASQGQGRLFVALYLGYYYCGQLLFYQFLYEDCYATIPDAHFYAEKCKAHAASLCTILYEANASPNCEMLHIMLGHVLVISSTVQIHTLLFDCSEDQIACARTRLERNFEILTRLREFWPMLDVVFIRLQTFHRACHTLRASSFRMDLWMLRFLSEFGRPIDDRVGEAATSPGSLMFWDS